MKAAIYYDVKDIRYEEIEKPEIEKDEVLIKMKACGLCGTDIHKVVHKTVKSGTVLGHEVSGDIVEVGEKVKEFEVGDRVFVAHHVPCFTCKYCLHEHHTLCKQFKDTNIVPGGFSEYIKISSEHVRKTMHKIPKNMTYEEATMAEPIACCIHGLKLLNIQHGDKVLILGAGQVGILHAQLVKQMNAGHIFISDISEFRLKKAKELGADVIINVTKENLIDNVMKETKGEGVDFIIISAGIPAMLRDAMSCISKGGTILEFSPFPKGSEVVLDVSRICEDEISIVGSYSSMPYEYHIALEMIHNNQIKVNEMITHHFSLSELDKAIKLASDSSQNYLKIMVRM